MYGWCLRLCWDGRAYCGWQIQPNGLSIQEVCEAALSEVLGGEAVRLHAAGRTDAGVHALEQVVGFGCRAERTAHAIERGMNTYLPEDIVCLSATPTVPEFRPRNWASRKTYRYRLLVRKTACPFRASYTWRCRGSLDVPAMRQAAEALVGAYDFASFRAQGCQSKHANRKIFSAEVKEQEDEIWIEFRGDAFLRHQVRIMVGTLVEIGRGRRSVGDMERILASRERGKAGPTAPARGLFLVNVELLEERRSS